MGKISYKDNAPIQTLWEVSFGYQTIEAKFLEKGWKLCSVKAVCKWVDEHGSATERKADSGRPRTARTEKNVERVAEFICSQEGQPDKSKSMRQVVKTLPEICLSIMQELNMSAL